MLCCPDLWAGRANLNQILLCKLNHLLMHMYPISKVGIPEHFRSELRQLISENEECHFKIYLEQGWSVWGGEVTPDLPHIQVNLCNLVLLVQAWYFFPGTYLPRNGTWWIGQIILVFNMWNTLAVDIFNVYFSHKRNIRRGWIISHLGICTTNPRTQWFYQWMNRKFIFS